MNFTSFTINLIYLLSSHNNTYGKTGSIIQYWFFMWYFILIWLNDYIYEEHKKCKLHILFLSILLIFLHLWQKIIWKWVWFELKIYILKVILCSWASNILPRGFRAFKRGIQSSHCERDCKAMSLKTWMSKTISYFAAS